VVLLDVLGLLGHGVVVLVDWFGRFTLQFGEEVAVDVFDFLGADDLFLLLLLAMGLFVVLVLGVFLFLRVAILGVRLLGVALLVDLLHVGVVGVEFAPLFVFLLTPLQVFVLLIWIVFCFRFYIIFGSIISLNL